VLGDPAVRAVFRTPSWAPAQYAFASISGCRVCWAHCHQSDSWSFQAELELNFNYAMSLPLQGQLSVFLAAPSPLRSRCRRLLECCAADPYDPHGLDDFPELPPSNIRYRRAPVEPPVLTGAVLSQPSVGSGGKHSAQRVASAQVLAEILPRGR